MTGKTKNLHHTDNGFINPYQEGRRTFKDYLKWQFNSNTPSSPTKHDPPSLSSVDQDILKSHKKDQTKLTWFGHSCFLIQTERLNILTDPIFSSRASPFKWIGPKRVCPPPLNTGDLPHIHLLLISHNHYDHLDRTTVKYICEQQKNQPVAVAPLGLAYWFHRHIKSKKVFEMDWWEELQIFDNHLSINCTPAQHFSGRGLKDHNKTLWCGWYLVNNNDHWKCFFAGDTGYHPWFKEIKDRYGKPDVSLLPIGAYEPRWFMKPVHMNPQDAIQAHFDLSSSLSIGMHWGTFKMTEEPVQEPPIKLQQSLDAYSSQKSPFITINPGTTVVMSNSIDNNKWIYRLVD